MENPSKDQIKERAKFLRQVLLEKHKFELPHGHALEVLAKVFGYKDWNTASALSNEAVHDKPIEDKVVEVSSKVRPPEVKLLTAGEYVDFFSTFARDTKIVVNEYEERELSHWGTITSVCSLTYDSEIQSGAELRLELNTEEERNYQLTDFGKSSNQSFNRTKAGRFQRTLKWSNMLNGFWSYSKPSDYLKS